MPAMEKDEEERHKTMVSSGDVSGSMLQLMLITRASSHYVSLEDATVEPLNSV
jgi:hypothetical protein